ncbi:sigma-54-dependent Fis family transcriptional regulator [Thermosyntropha sp.]|uniref:sigma-54-dependent Fis family transcriptional regulator n=1 Tax=Thermosyntropha sp. TaxID=2740820 RepID=UPI0025E1FACC|nr:sigma-54-dependent Fis family transcriptional regulator [Thermosyntropha sp.]MBO8158743.1 sigma-54-dependent Fis family transcriptional regulator [Thermosyntropha sp.]
MLDPEKGLEIKNIWQDFMRTGKLETAKLRGEIAESWIRCYKKGVLPQNECNLPVLSEDKIEELIMRKDVLIKIARPLMVKIHEFVAGSGFIVVLTDENGYVIEALGDKDVLEEAKKLISLGTFWAEEAAGTNSIGTAIKTGRPVQVSGPEHYSPFLHGWTCSAAPIKDEKGNIIGVIDISGPSEKTHLHTLGMAVSAAEAIMLQIKIQQKNQELTIINRRMNNVFVNMSDGVIFLDSEGFIQQMNPAAEKILRKGISKLKGVFIGKVIRFPRHVEDMLLNGNCEEYSDIEVSIKNQEETINCIASQILICDEKGKASGAIMILSPLRKVRNLVNRFSGSHATFTFDDIIGRDPKFLEAVKIARMAATTNSNVLLQGESGTGKELFAQAIHNSSSRCSEPFIAVNCGAIPRELLGSELFGYVEGAFTGAKKGGRPGKFELASGGTLFLDEIGEMPLGKQVALLRAIQEKEITRIGDDQVIPVDVRIISATNKDLYKEVRKGNFRQDLYYRLNVISITLPPLRERPGDIPLLFYYFLEDISSKLGCRVPDVDREVLAYLSSYSWPGNVRELHNVVERILNITGGQRITARDLPSEIREGKSSYEEKNLREENQGGIMSFSVEQEREKHRRYVEKEEYSLLITLLARHGGNISRVAKEMGVSRNTIYRKLRKYNILR